MDCPAAEPNIVQAQYGSNDISKYIFFSFQKRKLVEFVFLILPA